MRTERTDEDCAGNSGNPAYSAFASTPRVTEVDTFETTSRSSDSQRWSAWKTALLALLIFLPLAAVLLWFAFTNRVALADGGRPDDGTLPVLVAVLAAFFSAAGPAVLGAIIIANRKRTRAVLRPRVGKLVAAAVLAAIMPVLVVEWLPWIFGILFGMGLLDPDAWPWMLGLFAMFATCYVASSFIISGVRSKQLRLAVFALLWWSVYFAIMLVMGYQQFII